MIGKVNGREPRIHPSVFIASGAVVLGDVELVEDVSVWYGCVLRGDINWIKIGPRSNIQDGSVIHVANRGQGTWVGADVVVGHRVVLHSCRVEDGCLIGSGANLLDRCHIGQGSIVAAGSVVTPGQAIPPGVLVSGVPAKVRRELTDDERLWPQRVVNRYLRVAKVHQDPELVIDFSQEL
jgi:carbonic anhydrase/acetyltransferase-like protein (isoleucine patch superfamily)